MQTRHIQVDGIKMHWFEQGDGQPVVLIHGIPTTPKLWRHVIDRVTEAKLHAWEMVGYGESIPEGRDLDISVGRQADYLVAWMDAIGLERAILVGHDLGGGVAQIVAVRHPDRVSGLLLTNAICYDSWPIPSVEAMKRFHKLVAHMPEVLFRGAYKMLERRGHDDQDCASESIDAHLPYYLAGGGGAALARQVKWLDARDTLAVADDLVGLQIPAEVVWGVDDEFQKISYGERLANDLNAPLDRIEGGKHFVPEDHPDRIAAAISRLVHRVAEQRDSS